MGSLWTRCFLHFQKACPQAVTAIYGTRRWRKAAFPGWFKTNRLNGLFDAILLIANQKNINVAALGYRTGTFVRIVSEQKIENHWILNQESAD